MRPPKPFPRLKNGSVNQDKTSVARLGNGPVDLNKTPEDLVERASRNSTTPLLRLPAEIRQMIWGFALGGGYVKAFSRYSGRLKVYAVDDPVYREASSRSPFELLKVCRQIHSETALFPYSHNTFTISGTFITPLNRWLSAIQPAQRNAVTSVAVIHSFLNYYLRADVDHVRRSLRNFFPNLETIEVPHNEMWDVLDDPELYTIGMVTHTGSGCRDWLVEKLKEKEGQDIEIKLGDKLGYHHCGGSHQYFDSDYLIIYDEQDNDDLIRGGWS